MDKWHFQMFFLKEKFCGLIWMSQKNVLKGPIENLSPKVQVMAWRLTGAKPLAEPMINKISDRWQRHCVSMTSYLNKWLNKTDVGRRQTLGHPSSINPNMINHVPNNHLSFSKSNMLSVHEAIKISYSYHLPCQGSRNCQSQIYVSNHSFVDMVWSPFQYCPSI